MRSGTFSHCKKTTFENIKILCKSKGLSISRLETILGYGNGSLAKSKVLLSDRLYEIAKYFNVSMEYILTGKDEKSTPIIDGIPIDETETSIIREFRKLNADKQEMVLLLLQIPQKGDINIKIAE